jgi:hypothetical protein
MQLRDVRGFLHGARAFVPLLAMRQPRHIDPLRGFPAAGEQFQSRLKE